MTGRNTTSDTQTNRPAESLTASGRRVLVGIGGAVTQGLIENRVVDRLPGAEVFRTPMVSPAIGRAA